MISISDCYARFRRDPRLPEAEQMPVTVGAACLVSEHKGPMPIMVNIAASFLLWRRGPRRILRVRPETAAYLRQVRMSFVPQEAPAAWGGDAFVLESTQREHGELVAGCWSLAGYRLPDADGKPRYFWVGLVGEAADSWSIWADLGTLTERLARAGGLVAATETYDPEVGKRLWHHKTPPARQADYLRRMQFAFAASYYLERPDLPHVDVTVRPGPPERDARGKPRRAGGRPVPAWSYEDLTITPPAAGESIPRGPLDKAHLALKPVIVRPYIRRLTGGRVLIVDAYGSHRWARPERGGSKVKI